MAPPGPTLDEVRHIAAEVLGLFSNIELRGCLFRSTAGNLHGVPRTPNDVDLVVFTRRYTSEELKRHIVQNRPDHFYLVASMRQDQSYHDLLRCLPPRTPGDLVGRECKVDILVLGIPTLDIPYVPKDRVQWISGLPVMPLLPLLLLKLLGWHKRKDQWKKRNDAFDIVHLLRLAVHREEHIWQDNLPDSFIAPSHGWTSLC